MERIWFKGGNFVTQETAIGKPLGERTARFQFDFLVCILAFERRFSIRNNIVWYKPNTRSHQNPTPYSVQQVSDRIMLWGCFVARGTEKPAKYSVILTESPLQTAKKQYFFLLHSSKIRTPNIKPKLYGND